MATQQQQRNGIGALTSRTAISHAMPDRAAINAARINGAETRAEAQLDDVIASIGGRMIADAAAHTDQCASGEAGRSGSASPTYSSRLCLDCKARPAGAVGRSGSPAPLVCQACFDRARADLDASRARTDAVLSRMSAALAKPKPKPPVLINGLQLVCSCGEVEFTELNPEPDDDEVGFKGHRGGWQCDGCGKFLERAAVERDYE